MASGTSIGVGLGITLGVFVLIAVVLLSVGICTSKRRQQDIEQEMTQRREAIRQNYQREQAQWRERRLRQVVLVLVERGEAEEGVPLAFKLPSHSEVPARRALRNSRAAQRAVIESTVGDEDPRLDAEARAITLLPLSQLLANGRPQDAEPGPDVMQMLLEGQEVRPRGSSDEDENSDEFIELPAEELARLQQQQQQWPSRAPSRQASRLGTPQAQAIGSGAEGNNGRIGDEEAAASEGSFSPADAEGLERRRREEAIIKELRAEKDNTRRRKTAEELYGVGTPYLINPNNEAVVRNLEINDVASPLGQSHHGRSFGDLTSSKFHFLSPLTPWRGGKHKSKSFSAFDGRDPNASRDFGSHVGVTPRGPATPVAGASRGARAQADSRRTSELAPVPKTSPPLPRVASSRESSEPY